MVKVYAPAGGERTRSMQCEREQACDLCGGHEVELVSLRDRREDPLPTVVCTACGLVSHLHVPSDEQLADYYAREYRVDYHGEVAPSAHRVVRAWKTGHRLLKILSPFLQSDDRVFEVGAGIGCTVKAFQLAGYEARGIEPGQGFSRFSRESLQAAVDNVTLADVPSAPQFDVVLLVHVIEHLNRPSMALRHIHQLLRPSGRLYVECPNVAAPHAAPGKLFHYAHIHNFTPKTLRMMGAASGFRLVKSLADDRDRNLMMVFERSSNDEFTIDPSSYPTTRAALERFSKLSYHLRWRYLAQRVGSLAEHFGQRIFARRQMGRIIAACQSGGDRAAKSRQAA